MAASLKIKLSPRFWRILAITRAFSSTFVMHDDQKITKMMQKFLQKKQRKKSHHWTIPYVRQPAFVGLEDGRKKKSFSDGMQKRASHINHIFYETISQIIANGELDMYIDITKVKVAPDFSGVVVYWEGKGTEEDVETEKALEEQAGYLRSLLIRSNVLGRVPPVTFAKDKTYTGMLEVERLLRIAELPPPEEELEDDKEMSAKSDDELENVFELTVESKDGVKLGDEAEEISKPFDEFNKYIHDENMHKKIENHGESVYSGYMENITDKVKLRQDLYGVKHDVLMQKIAYMKNSSKQRLQQQDDVDSFKGVNSFEISKKIDKVKKDVAKKTRAENLKKYTEFFHKEKHKDRTHKHCMIDLRQEPDDNSYDDNEYIDETEAEFDSGIEEYYGDEFSSDKDGFETAKPKKQ